MVILFPPAADDVFDMNASHRCPSVIVVAAPDIVKFRCPLYDAHEPNVPLIVNAVDPDIDASIDNVPPVRVYIPIHMLSEKEPLEFDTFVHEMKCPALRQMKFGIITGSNLTVLFPT